MSTVQVSSQAANLTPAAEDFLRELRKITGLTWIGKCCTKFMFAFNGDTRLMAAYNATARRFELVA